MNPSEHTATGFTLLYCALMAALVVVTIPYLEGWRSLIAGVLLLPCGLIGMGLLIYGRMYAPKKSSWVREI